MTVTPLTPPPLPDELQRLLRRLRLPYVRRAAPVVIATAAAQRWEHAEVLRILLGEEAAGREATIRIRRTASGLPAGKTSDVWEQAASAIPKPAAQALRTLEWIDRAEMLCICGPSGTSKQEPLHRSARPSCDRQRQDGRVAHARDPSRSWFAATASTTASAKRSRS